MDQGKEIFKEGWMKETEERKVGVTNFVREYLVRSTYQRSENQNILQPREYDNLTEFHTSGGGPTLRKKIVDGTADLLSVDVLYKDEQPTQIHIVFSAENSGNMDIYLTKQALSDYLRTVSNFQ